MPFYGLQAVHKGSHTTKKDLYFKWFIILLHLLMTRRQLLTQPLLQFFMNVFAVFSLRGGGSLPHSKIIKSYVIPFYGPQAVHKVLNTT